MSVLLKLCLCFRGISTKKQYNQVQSLSVSHVQAQAAGPTHSPSQVPSSQPSPRPPPAQPTQPPALRKESSGVYVIKRDKVTLLEQPSLAQKSHEAPVFASQDKVSSVRKRLASL